MEPVYIALGISIILISCAMHIANYLYIKAFNEVSQRRIRGDTSCKVVRSFWGYRVKEYAEGIDLIVREIDRGSHEH